MKDMDEDGQGEESRMDKDVFQTKKISRKTRNNIFIL
jgi:hypothetical protein